MASENEKQQHSPADLAERILRLEQKIVDQEKRIVKLEQDSPEGQHKLRGRYGAS